MKMGGRRMKLTLFACAASLFALPAAADCLFIGGNAQRSCPPGEKIVKNGPGNGTAFLKAGSYVLDMNGPGYLCLKGLKDYSGVTGEKNGPGILYYSEGVPPNVNVLGPGGMQEGCP
jgi:hypothetical protein